jgi:hypothetical protein
MPAFLVSDTNYFAGFKGAKLPYAQFAIANPTSWLRSHLNSGVRHQKPAVTWSTKLKRFYDINSGI